jgi:hypothetical protein
MTKELPPGFNSWTAQVDMLRSWVKDGIDQDEFDRRASRNPFHKVAGAQIGADGDSFVIGFNGPGWEWMELLYLLQASNLVIGTRRGGVVHYTLPEATDEEAASR